MRLRARIWPGLRTRSIWFDLGIALLSSVSVAVGAAAPSAGSMPGAVLIAGGTLLLLALALFRRRAPLVPFALAALLSAFSPAVTIGLAISSYAVGRYVRRWPVRIAAALVGALAFVHPWSPGSLDQFISNVAGIAVIVVLPGVLGVWVRTRALLL